MDLLVYLIKVKNSIWLKWIKFDSYLEHFHKIYIGKFVSAYQFD